MANDLLHEMRVRLEETDAELERVGLRREQARADHEELLDALRRQEDVLSGRRANLLVAIGALEPLEEEE